MPTTSLSDLTLALEFISDDCFPDNEAYLCIATGKVLCKSEEFPSDQELPKNSLELLNESLYIKIPTKRDFGFGVHNALQFIAINLPDEYNYLETSFRRRGGWSQFRNTLRAHNCNNQWHEFEDKCIEKALRKWCSENGIAVN